jgi:hypothetical protein
MVWEKAENSLEYRGNFFTYTDAEIETEGAAGDERNVYIVEFDPIPQNWGFGEEWGYDECDDVEAMGEYDPMKHPIRSTKMNIRDEEYIENCLGGWMELEKDSPWEQVINEATDCAMKMGWNSW